MLCDFELFALGYWVIPETLSGDKTKWSICECGIHIPPLFSIIKIAGDDTPYLVLCYRANHIITATPHLDFITRKRKNVEAIKSMPNVMIVMGFDDDSIEIDLSNTLIVAVGADPNFYTTENVEQLQVEDRLKNLGFM